MKKVFYFSIVLFTISFLIGCQASQSGLTSDPNADPVPVEVQLTVPEVGELGESIAISALVTVGDEEVDDADVEFEIWPLNQKEDSIMIDVEKQDNGTYHIEYTFEEAGEYEVQVHVTARRMHVMPVKKITIE